MDTLMEDHDIVRSLDGTGELRELVNLKKWIAVVDFCERKAKKGDQGDTLQCLRAIALLLDSRPSKKDAGCQELEALLDRTPPVNTPSALALLDGLQDAISPNELLATKLQRAWERAATSTQLGDGLLKAWFQAKFRRALYFEAKQVWLLPRQVFNAFGA
ncbi:uncharacterized protein KY384_009111 [Bacidia gigantensis]|uniref:uncharacterized protein n=1 Tax=Bacidia gigantensis TaxID=2732470 RepID=UPI001D045AB9|nr:uncharacterized protein KY384_009111 [Bacidia gigantensis]KAG8525467.1 hypothetical protein KY384_009111 [Bacidia gigantensis]